MLPLLANAPWKVTFRPRSIGDYDFEKLISCKVGIGKAVKVNETLR